MLNYCSFIEQITFYNMEKQDILDKYYKQLKIENYSNQTIKSYYSVLNSFLNYIQFLKLGIATDEGIQKVFLK